MGSLPVGCMPSTTAWHDESDGSQKLRFLSGSCQAMMIENIQQKQISGVDYHLQAPCSGLFSTFRHCCMPSPEDRPRPTWRQGKRSYTNEITPLPMASSLSDHEWSSLLANLDKITTVHIDGARGRHNGCAGTRCRKRMYAVHFTRSLTGRTLRVLQGEFGTMTWRP